MDVSVFDWQNVRLSLKNGEIFDGLCSYCHAEYMLAEYGTEKDALQIDDWIFYESEISGVSLLQNTALRFWLGKPLHCMRLAPAPFKMIERGEKTVELRLLDEKRRTVRTGDIVRFESSADAEDVLYAEVTALHTFPSFAALYRALPLEKCGYTAETAKNASPHDMDVYYPPEEQRAFGVVGIEIKLL